LKSRGLVRQTYVVDAGFRKTIHRSHDDSYEPLVKKYIQKQVSPYSTIIDEGIQEQTPLLSKDTFFYPKNQGIGADRYGIIPHKKKPKREVILFIEKPAGTMIRLAAARVFQ